jgi:alginate O-acetyltransferase complex protein AlgI
MAFSSALFLFGFLPLVLGTYHLVPDRFRNGVALAASLAFYAWGAPQFVLVLIGSSWLDYVLARAIRSTSDAIKGKRLLTLAVGLNVGVLVYCKYMNFFVEQANVIAAAAGLGQLTWTSIVLPIGISFFTFQKISYLVDVYRRQAQPAGAFGHYLLYVVLFPQLIAGPIVRYHDVASQIRKRSHSDEQFLVGTWRFTIGLAKKVLIADTLAVVADAAFGATAETAADPSRLSYAAAWVAAICYAMQLYYDFSGYSDMAIGLGKMLGFDFLENFNQPYISKSVTEFWRRWHISLSNWMREYLYVPLGGNRVPRWRMYANLWIVFLASGFWHGASWNFVIWGAIHGALLTAERLASSFRLPRWPAVLAIPRTFFLVLIAWIFFRAWDVSQAVRYLGVMVTGSTDPSVTVNDLLTPQAAFMLVIAIALTFSPLFSQSYHYLNDWAIGPKSRGAGLKLAFRSACGMVLLVASATALMSSQFHPFIYFRF